MPDRRPSRLRQYVEAHSRQVIAALVAVGAILLIVAVTTATATLGRITEETDAVEETLLRQASLNRLATFNEQIENGRRGFLIQPEPVFVGVVREATGNFDAELATLEQLYSGEYEGVEALERIAELQRQRSTIVDESLANPELVSRRGVAADTDSTGQESSSETEELPQESLSEFENGAMPEEVDLFPAPSPGYDLPSGLAADTGFDSNNGVVLLREIRVLTDQLLTQQETQLTTRSRNQLNSLVQFYVVGGIALFLLLLLMGTVIFLVLRYNRDLTAAQIGLRRANETLEGSVAARTAELLRANEEIQRFAYIVSHDLRSPLVNVLGFTSELDEARKVIHAYLEELFRDHPDMRQEDVWLAVEEDLPEALGFIRTSTEKMDRLINSILELSRQGRRPLAPEELDMDELVTQIVDSLQQTIEAAGAEVVINSIPNLQSDRIAVEQILQNLIENALKYLSPKRPGEITIEGSRNSGMVLIDVIDNGRGIDPQDHSRIFDLFRRAGTQDQQGEGIGLANVRALAYRLGGTIEVESELDRGARFRLSLPTEFAPQES